MRSPEGNRMRVDLYVSLTNKDLIGFYEYYRKQRLDDCDFPNMLSRECIQEIMQLQGVQSICFWQYYFTLERSGEGEFRELVDKVCQILGKYYVA